MAWRRGAQSATFTPFNRYCTQIVRRALPRLEVHACLASNSGSGSSSRHATQQQQIIALEEALLSELDEITTVHHLVGYPLHVSPMVDFEQIAAVVRSTGLHSIDANNNSSGRDNSGSSSNTSNTSKMVEFIISVYVHPYPANVHSIWIYAGALMPKA